MNDTELIGRLHHLDNQVNSCGITGPLQGVFLQCANWCIRTYKELVEVANVDPVLQHDAEIQALLLELDKKIMVLCLRR